MITLVRFLQLYLGALVVGTMFAVYAGYDPRGFSYATYVEQHQGAVAGLNVLIPALAGAMIVLTLLLAYLLKGRPGQAGLLLAGAVCFVGAGLATRLGCQPINAVVDTWSVGVVQDNWEALRADWWHYHLVRMFSGMLGYALVLFAALRPQA